MGLMTAPTSGSASIAAWNLARASSAFGSEMQPGLPLTQTSMIDSPGSVFCTNFVSR